MPVIAVLALVNGGRYFLWYRRARRAVDAGASPVYRRSKISRTVNAVMQAYLLFGLLGGLFLDSWYERDGSSLIIMGILVAGSCLYMIGFTFFDVRHNQKRQGHLKLYYALAVPLIIVLCVISGVLFAHHSEYVYDGKEMVHAFTDELPLTMEDMGIEAAGYVYRCADYEGSPFLQCMIGNDSSVNPGGYDLSYRLFTTKFDWIYRRVVRERYRNLSELQEISDSGFSAEHIYVLNKDYDLLLLYENAILELDTNIPLSKVQKERIERKLFER